jgi:NAD(P)-dependent dehydrogenase (short-subunit alcohol dehydrogenase family)
MFNIDLKDKVTVITGASQGIGKAIAEVFAGAGSSLILLSRNKAKLEENAKKLKAKYHILDVSKSDDVEKIFSQIENIDILINNAGIHFTSPVENMDVRKWKELLDINLNGVMYCSKAAINNMMKNKKGRIINIASISGKVGDAYGSAYSASKFGVIGFTQSLAQEAAKYNITVNAVCPGWVETEMAEEILRDKEYARLHNMKIDELKKTSLEAVPIGRYIQPSEIAYLTLFLTSNYADAITGQSINIDGGVYMH